MKKYFLTFGGPSENYRRRVSEVVNKVISLNLFDDLHLQMKIAKNFSGTTIENNLYKQ